MSDSLSTIETRLLHEKQMSKDEVEMVMAVIEEELVGETNRDGADYKLVGDGRLHKGET